MANFLSISPNQTKFLPSICMVPGLDFSAIPDSIFAESLGKLSIYILYFLDFKVYKCKWAMSLLTLSSNPFKYCKYVYFNIHYANIATAEFLVISAESTCWEIESNSQIFNGDFYLPLYLPLWRTCSSV